ncbi:MAG: ABC transporter permease [Nanoarchaeota archaeon]|nr:ABC transporter permease [Nanoarchaeota archaeon]MBU1322059.1 ABC transporter permease [Nanoarchaeota archaeon]MBU1597251.1 ABC transporter permease [Nanoarchaeota archaeon]MBU2440704.1 ABC transporter permease [Nanoarchaeota archaeon]
MIKLLFNEFKKNIKILFRNWTSLFLLVIVPVILILLIGYAFSSDEITGTSIGVVSQEGINITPLINDVSAYAIIQEFDTIDACLVEMALQKIHICINLEGLILEEKIMISGFENIPSGKVTYYYDNTRKKVALIMVQNIQDFFGLKSEQISIESTENIIENIQSLIGFINERKNDIIQIREESISIERQLIERNEKLESVREDFIPKYMLIKDLQNKLHNYSSELDSATEKLTTTIDTVIISLKEVSNITINISSEGLINQTDDMTDEVTNGAADNITYNVLFNMHLNELFNNLTKQLLELSDLINVTNAKFHSGISMIDDTISQIDTIKNFLDEEIERNNAYVTKINKSIVRIDEVTTELDDKLNQLNKLNPETAKKLIKPIISDYNKLLKNATNIQLSFPQLLAMIIMFISLLFSNTSTLMEINNKAYQRNLIAPLNDTVYVIGMLFTWVVIVFFQILVLFIVAQTKLGIMISQIFWQISLISLLLISIFILLGMLFAYLFRTIQISILITTFTALILFLFSNALAPLEAMPGFARLLSQHNPLVIGEFLYKEVQLFGIPMTTLATSIFLLVIFALALLFIVIALAKNRNKKRL